MKNLKKNLLTLACALLLVVATVFTTLAYLVDSNNIVTNTFTVGKVDIDMDETNVDPDDPNDPPRDKVNEYPLTPGTTHTKDPIIHVKPGSQESYLFVKLENGLNPLVKTEDIVSQMTGHGWTLVPGQEDIYYYQDTVTGHEAGENAEDVDIPVFDSITIPESADEKTLDGFGSKTIVVTAYAIQVSDNFTGDNFEEKAAAAWDALVGQLA